jgi:hypothetical protein
MRVVRRRPSYYWRVGWAVARLPVADQLLLALSLVLVWIARVSLWLLPYRVVRSMTEAAKRRRGAAIPSERYARTTTDAIAWAVEAGARYVPAATCLTQALVADYLLARHGLPSELCLGASVDEHGQLRAHAWVECRGRTVVGGAEQAKFSIFQSVGTRVAGPARPQP